MSEVMKLKLRILDLQIQLAREKLLVRDLTHALLTEKGNENETHKDDARHHRPGMDSGLYSRSGRRIPGHAGGGEILQLRHG